MFCATWSIMLFIAPSNLAIPPSSFSLQPFWKGPRMPPRPSFLTSGPHHTQGRHSPLISPSELQGGWWVLQLACHTYPAKQSSQRFLRRESDTSPLCPSTWRTHRELSWWFSYRSGFRKGAGISQNLPL